MILRKTGTWIGLLSILFIMNVSIAHAQVYTPPPEDLTIAKKYPEYILVTRQWNDYGGIYTSSEVRKWNYTYKSFVNISAVLKELNDGGGYNFLRIKYRNVEIIGLWKLGESRNIFNETIILEEILHEKRIVVEKKEWTEKTWKLNQDGQD